MLWQISIGSQGGGSSTQVSPAGQLGVSGGASPALTIDVAMKAAATEMARAVKIPIPRRIKDPPRV
jgi:hypothetical protein